MNSRCFFVRKTAWNLKNQGGFSMIELIMILVIVGILAAVTVVLSMGDSTVRAIAEASALKNNLRYTQSKAMSDLPGTIWSLNITASGYSIQRNGAAPVPAVNLPGSDPATHATYNLPSGVSVSGGTGQVRFDFRGRPVDNLGSPLNADFMITVYGAPALTVTRTTGFIP
jgi:type II secretory pathway pseudopilin PulG